MSHDELAHVDLRPSPWIIHRWVIGLIAAGYVGYGATAAIVGAVMALWVLAP